MTNTLLKELSLEPEVHNMILERMAPLATALEAINGQSNLETFKEAAEAIEASLTKKLESIAVPSTVTIKCQNYSGTVSTVEGAHPDLAKMIYLLTQQELNYRNSYWYGEAGCGKTHAAFQAAEALGLPVHIQGTAMSKYDLLGFKLPTGETIRTPFMDAWINGGVIILDDNDRSDPKALSALNAALANGRCDFSNSGQGVVDRHPDCIVIITGNTAMTGQNALYNTASKQDGALRDRLVYWELRLDEALEKSLCASNPEWVARVQCIRAAANELGGNVAQQIFCSMRASIQGLNLFKDSPLTQAEIEEAIIFKGAGEDIKRKIYSACGDPSTESGEISNPL